MKTMEINEEPAGVNREQLKNPMNKRDDIFYRVMEEISKCNVHIYV